MIGEVIVLYRPAKDEIKTKGALLTYEPQRI